MHDMSLDTFIDAVRAIAPMDSATNDLDVVDGLVLLQKLQDPSFWNNPGLPAAGTTQRTSLMTAIARLNDALDSVADLTLAESVHQLARGNLLRAGATLDSIARGDTPPAEIEVVTTPRSGTGLGYRLMAIAPAGGAAGWSATPGAQAEPRLNAWAGALLGDPKRVRIRAQFLDAQGAGLSTVEIGLDQLGLAPLDILSLPEAQGVAQDLGDRIRRTAWQTRLAGAADVRLLTDRDPAWKPQVVALTEWLILVQAVSRLVNGARPLTPSDLVVQGDSPGTMDTAELTSRGRGGNADAVGARLAQERIGERRCARCRGGVRRDGRGTEHGLHEMARTNRVGDCGSDTRAAQLDQLAAGFTRASATPQQSCDFDSARLRAVFGALFQALPMLAQGASDLWANSSSLQVNDPLESVRWFQRAARVRPGAARLDTAAMLAEALSGQLLLQFQVAQLPAVSGDQWMALAGSTSSSRLSLVAFSPAAVTAGAPIAGLMIDEWTEVLPSSQQITGVSFQYTDPIRGPRSRSCSRLSLMVFPSGRWRRWKVRCSRRWISRRFVQWIPTRSAL